MWKRLFGWMWNEKGFVAGDDDTETPDNTANEGVEDADEEQEEGDTEKDTSKKDRTSKFKEYKSKAEKVERLMELGILQEDDDGNLVLNPKVTEKKADKKEGDDDDLHFKESEIHKDSWPLAQKINKMYDASVKTSQRQEFFIRTLQAENAILRDYPEFIQKDSPLKKKALDILKNDPEFKKTYRGNPEASYWAVKRAAEALENKSTPKTQPKKNQFIIGKGDIEAGGKKTVDISKLSEADLDKLEREEHERMSKLKK